ncbi:WecB/TagA/CpsF family glycosyltransferase [Candidatus Uhrbacteria bacterium]|nr:WecB/TagA/CpsF family glycosyltransferase [Candidatus Uhrbacteria bacterium]
MERPLRTFTCFGLVIHGFSLVQILDAIQKRMETGQASMVVTTNPEILLAAKQQPSYWNILRQADLRLVDGFGLQLVGWFKGARPTRITGVTLAEAILQQAVVHQWKIGLVGGKPGNADKAAWNIRKDYPSLTVYAEQGGSVSMEGIMDEEGNEALFRLTQQAPDVLLIAFGHPKQEQWIVRHLASMPSVKLAIGVGGTFEYWAGDVKRAPKILQKIGLEWLWRLVQQPSRFGRIWNAVIRFPWAALTDEQKGIKEF